MLIDLGHQVNLGLIEPLAALLAPRVSYVRIIRSRYDTVRSFAAENKAPCGHGMWTLCPLGSPDTVLVPPDATTWAHFDLDQRNLWFIDEVEARWQRLLRRRPGTPHLTMSWCTSAQLHAGWEAVAAFISDQSWSVEHGMQKPIGVPASCSHHSHGSESVTDAQLAVKDQAYQRAMGYSEETLQTIRAVLRPGDCA